MKTRKFSDERIAMALRQAEAGPLIGEICRKLGVIEQTFYRWRERFRAVRTLGLQVEDPETDHSLASHL